MYHIVRRRGCFIAQPRHVVVLDIIPSDVGHIEHIQRHQLVGKLTYWSEPTWEPIAVLAPANAAPLWRLERSADGAQITIRALGPITLSATKSYELWILPSGGGNPVSLGLMPRHGKLERRLTPVQRTLLAAARQIAVSVEPLGGSPTGLPTGPVVIVASVMRAT